MITTKEHKAPIPGGGWGVQSSGGWGVQSSVMVRAGVPSPCRLRAEGLLAKGADARSATGADTMVLAMVPTEVPNRVHRGGSPHGGVGRSVTAAQPLLALLHPHGGCGSAPPSGVIQGDCRYRTSVRGSAPPSVIQGEWRYRTSERDGGAALVYQVPIRRGWRHSAGARSWAGARGGYLFRPVEVTAEGQGVGGLNHGDNALVVELVLEDHLLPVCHPPAMNHDKFLRCDVLLRCKPRAVPCSNLLEVGLDARPELGHVGQLFEPQVPAVPLTVELRHHVDHHLLTPRLNGRWGGTGLGPVFRPPGGRSVGGRTPSAVRTVRLRLSHDVALDVDGWC
eukprot:Hpha_TRINITY_DN16776_c0_g1::TRINITY_DN16776_c0_g1_i2::g.76453::m.76453